MMLIFVAYLNYLVDTYLMYAASAIAANTIVRSAAGASAPLFTRQMFGALGVGPGGSLVAGVATLLAGIPFLFYRYGERIRIRSRFAPTGGSPDKPVVTTTPDDEEKQGGGYLDAAARREEGVIRGVRGQALEEDGVAVDSASTATGHRQSVYGSDTDVGDHHHPESKDVHPNSGKMAFE